MLVPAALVLALIVLADVRPDLLPPLGVVPHAAAGLAPAEPSTTPLGALLAALAAGMFLVAAIRSRRHFRESGTIDEAYFTVGLVFAAFAQVDAVFDPTYAGLVSSGDVFRLAFYIVLLLGLNAENHVTLRALSAANATLIRLQESELERAALEERSRLSRELHDGLAQDLWFAKLKVGRLAAMPGLLPEAQALTNELSSAIESGLDEARQAVMALRLAPDPDQSFADLLARSIDDFEDRFALRTEFECQTELRHLPTRVEAELLRIAQEALSNVAHHADATVIRVKAALDEGRILLSVSDNGRGFDPLKVDGEHFGLAAMRERATGRRRAHDRLEPPRRHSGAGDGPGAGPGRGARRRATVTAGGPRARLRVMLVDDHALVRSAVRQAISGPDLELVAEAATAEEALLLAPQVQPDILLLDIDLPGMSGVLLVRELAPRLPATRIVMLTVSRADRDLDEAIRHGAVGYLTKDLTPEALARAVRAAYDGDLVMNRRMAGRLVRRLVGEARAAPAKKDDVGVASLSGRERGVLRLLADGLTDREIATSLTISPRTVETHVSNIIHKLGVRNRAEAARRYRDLA